MAASKQELEHAEQDDSAEGSKGTKRRNHDELRRENERLHRKVDELQNLGRREDLGRELIDKISRRHYEEAYAIMDGAHTATITATDRWGTTPLHAAARLGNPKLVKELLGKRADPNAKTYDT